MLLAITLGGCVIVGLLGALVGIMVVAVSAMIIDWLRFGRDA